MTLRVFNTDTNLYISLLAHNSKGTSTENPRVGGSIPPLGTIFLDFQRVIPWVARGLLVAVSMAISSSFQSGFTRGPQSRAWTCFVRVLVKVTTLTGYFTVFKIVG